MKDKIDLNNASNIIQVEQTTNKLSFQVTQWEPSTSVNLNVSGDDKLLSSQSNNPSEFEHNSNEAPTHAQTCELIFCQEEVWGA